MAVITRYSITDRVAISFTGNTLGLIGTFNPSQATTTDAADGIGTFITTNTALQSPGGYPSGTTQTFSQNSSSAILTMLSGSTILYAELIWSGIQSNALQNVSSSTNNAVQLRTPTGQTFNISPDPATSQNITNIVGVSSPYGRTANITSIVQASGVGTYTISNVPCALGGTTSSTSGTVESNYLGWTLAIVYRNPALKYRNITFWVMFEGISQNSTVNVPISGFGTPSSGAFTSRLVVSAGSGDTYLNGDIVSFGPNTSSLTVLSGPNNLSTNFFASQINFADSEFANVGQLNTTGTFGNNNQPIGSKALNGRQGWDITNVNVTNAMTLNQTSAIIRFSTSADVYVPTALGLQIDVNAANIIEINKSRDLAFATIGDIITYTVTFKNAGLLSANNVVFMDTIPTSTTFQNNSLTLNGAPQTTSPLPPGINLGSILPNVSTTIAFKVIVTTVPSNNLIQNQAGLGYNYTSAVGLPPTPAFDTTNIVTTVFNYPNLLSTKQVSKAYANIFDILTYTITIGAAGNATANNIIFIDTIPNDTTYIGGTLTENGVPKLGNTNPPGITLNNIFPGRVSTIVFRVRVNTIPNPNPILNSSTTTYNYIVDPTLSRIGTGYSNSNIVNTRVNNASLINSVKYASRSFGDCGDEISYTIVIPNSGNVTAQNVVFKDTIPNGTTLLPETFRVNGNQILGANPSLGVTIPNIAPGETTTINFSVKVIC